MTIDASKLVRRARKDLSKSDNPATRAAFFGIGLTSMAGGYLMGGRGPKGDAPRVGGVLRRSRREAVRQADYAAGVAKGAAHKMTPGSDSSTLNDPALARKVETEIFRAADAPKGNVSVNAENGVVYLRGQLKRPEQIDELVTAARAVDGVTEVRSLLHT